MKGSKMNKFKGFITVLLGVSLLALAGCASAEEGGEEMEEMAEEESVVNVETAYPAIRTISQLGSYYTILTLIMTKLE